MKAAVLHGKELVTIEEIPPPPLKPGEVRIRIEAALTCGTDVKVFKRGYHAKMIVPPAVFGHELAGTLSEVASDVSDWKIGDRVAVANSAPCGDCAYCRREQENLCDDLLFLNGAYAESIAVPARLVQKTCCASNLRRRFGMQRSWNHSPASNKALKIHNYAPASVSWLSAWVPSD